ncbi:haloacid dehalogenase superfamily protein, subfamily IA, variant 3 with third motif having DD or ED [Mycolicibacterium aurum]|uniref:Haloacid dehalogenase superfamily protein, subfamily IA, variant 3 with third motif having DD or ED n=1 Tax=Mycolicibacterium aurum TaxID=1791 RepID=A0A3S5EJE3_MYCAU|nr:HAD-IA family hydrolase [Mycolicibacterium aurum]VEG54621.1 haloacid dehalogenase superfamily protein, subfamily IA, variant 3 with third motif having DD or ED [Mycolicibacterium aurum]
MSALLFGSISTLADTSELQRRAFNEAFEAHGLEWNWSREDYAAMLGSNGGQDRIAEFAKGRNEDVDAAAVHATKSSIFQELLGTSGVSARPGVIETVQRAKRDGLRLGFVTTTSADNIAALLGALAPDVTAETFDIVVDGSAVTSGKPDPEVYRYALAQLGEDAGDTVAIEDNPGGVRAATGAGISCVAFPNENTAEGDFGGAAATVDALDADHVVSLLKS